MNRRPPDSAAPRPNNPRLPVFWLFLGLPVAVGLFHLLPALLFYPETPHRNQAAARERSTIIATGEFAIPDAEYELRYQDPTVFLHGDDDRSFGAFRTTENASFPALPETLSASPAALPAPSGTPVPGPVTKTVAGPENRNLIPAEPLGVGAVPTDTPIGETGPAEQTRPQETWPCLLDERGRQLTVTAPAAWTELLASAGSPELPTVLGRPPVEFQLPDLPPELVLRRSCGLAELDLAAIRLLNQELMKKENRADWPESVTVYWKNPGRAAVSPTPDDAGKPGKEGAK